jgi:hypothetical protein
LWGFDCNIIENKAEGLKKKQTGSIRKLNDIDSFLADIYE